MNPRPKAYESSALPLSYSGPKFLENRKSQQIKPLGDASTHTRAVDEMQANAKIAAIATGQFAPTAKLLTTVSSFLFEGNDFPPQVGCSPNAPAQCFELDDLAMIHKQVYIRTEILDVPRKYGRVSGFEHQMLQAECGGKLRAHRIART